MKPLFTIHAGEYLVGAHIEHTYPDWNVWLLSKDTGVDFLVTDGKNRKAVSLQVKFSKDFNPTHDHHDYLLAAGWWTHDLKKIQKSEADFWVFVLTSFWEKEKTSFIILPPAELARRLKAIHGDHTKRIHSYLRVTKSERCWEARGLGNAEMQLIADDQFSDKDRDFTKHLNAWKPIEAKLK